MIYFFECHSYFGLRVVKRHWTYDVIDTWHIDTIGM